MDCNELIDLLSRWNYSWAFIIKWWSGSMFSVSNPISCMFFVHAAHTKLIWALARLGQTHIHTLIHSQIHTSWSHLWLTCFFTSTNFDIFYFEFDDAFFRLNVHHTLHITITIQIKIAHTVSQSQYASHHHGCPSLAEKESLNPGRRSVEAVGCPSATTPLSVQPL